MLDSNSSISVTPVDFSKLQEFLEAGDWVKADNETLAILLQLAGLENEDKLSVEHIEKIADSDLKAIDQLWVNYSNGRFGFSVQKSLYKGSLSSFCWQVGWIETVPQCYADLCYACKGYFRFTRSNDVIMPKGHLPECLLWNTLKQNHPLYGLCSWGGYLATRADAAAQISRWCDSQLKTLEYILSHSSWK